MKGQAAYGWKDAWEQIEDEHMYAGTRYYDLHTKSLRERIYEGDQFWDSSKRVLIEVDAVKTKIYQGVVQPTGKEGGDFVFYHPDWTPHIPPTYRNYREQLRLQEQPDYCSVDDFIDRIENGELTPHKGNGLPPLPP